MNWEGSWSLSAPVSGSKPPNAIGRSQPSKVRAPQSRRRPARIDSQAAAIESPPSTSTLLGIPLAGVCTVHAPLCSSRPFLATALLKAQKSPRGEAPPGMPLLDAFLLCAGEKFDPPDGRCRKPRRVRSSEKNLSHTNSFVDIKKTAELRHFSIKIVFFQKLEFVSGPQRRANRGKT
jgi:hypothetical protein